MDKESMRPLLFWVGLVLILAGVVALGGAVGVAIRERDDAQQREQRQRHRF